MTGKKNDNDYQASLFHDDLEYEEDQNYRENLSSSTVIYSTVKPEMLLWGRQYAYLSIDDASQRIGVPVEKLREWENGVSSPTVVQLHKIARVYKQLFAVFYMQKPPKPASLPLKDFRRLPSTGISEISYELAGEIRTAINRREIAVRMVEEMEEEPIEFSLTANLREKPSAIAEKVRSLLFSDLSKIPSFTNKYNAFRFFRERLERLGILVFQSSSISVSEMRGFSIYESQFPVIVVNRKDSPAGRIFSLFHELTHILLRTAGVCEIDPDITLPPEKQEIEVFCNKVSAEILMPYQLFFEHAQHKLLISGDTFYTDLIILQLSNEFGVSREAVVRRLLTLNLVSKEFYQSKRDQFLQEIPDQTKQKKSESRPISPAKTIVSLAGKTYISLVLNAMGQNRITLNDASGFLNLRIKQISVVGHLVGM
ncbi:MAG: XRE family transcriptional regulator [Bellilinea sp.]